MDKLAGAILVGLGTLSVSVLVLAHNLRLGLIGVARGLGWDEGAVRPWKEYDPFQPNVGYVLSFITVAIGLYILVGRAFLKWWFTPIGKKASDTADKDIEAIEKKYEERYGKQDDNQQDARKKDDES